MCRKFSQKQGLLLFREIDRAASGFITRRQAIVELQKHLETNDLERVVISMKEMDIGSHTLMTFNSFLDVLRHSGLLVGHLVDKEMRSERAALNAELQDQQIKMKQNIGEA